MHRAQTMPRIRKVVSAVVLVVVMGLYAYALGNIPDTVFVRDRHFLKTGTSDRVTSKITILVDDGTCKIQGQTCIIYAYYAGVSFLELCIGGSRY